MKNISHRWEGLKNTGPNVVQLYINQSGRHGRLFFMASPPTSVENSKHDPLCVLADAAAIMQNELRDDVRIACDLAAMPIDKSWSIEVFADGTFWDAMVLHTVGHDGFEIRYRSSIETAYVRRADFLKTWRFPFDPENFKVYDLLIPDDHV